MKWINAESLGILGKGFDTVGYRRITEEDNAVLSEKFPLSVMKHHLVYFPKLGRESAGLHIDFETDSKSIYVRWTVNYFDFSDESSVINQSGMDLYIFKDNRWRFLNSTVFENKKSNECKLADNLTKLPAGKNKYTLNLATYDEITKLEIGIDDDAQIQGLKAKEDYIVIYGSSITQGGCASRPGLIYPNQIRLKLREEVINLGFCGMGFISPEMVNILNKLNPKLMIMDCIPNMTTFTPEEFKSRYMHFYNVFRKSHKETPIIFTEKAMYTNEWAGINATSYYNSYLKKIFAELSKNDKNIYYIEGENLYGSDEASSDGIHPNDMGHTNMANIYINKIKEILYTDR